MAVPARPVDCIEQLANTSFLDLEPDMAYRIRVVNTGYVNTGAVMMLITDPNTAPWQACHWYLTKKTLISFRWTALTSSAPSGKVSTPQVSYTPASAWIL